MRSLSDDILSKTELAEIENKIDSLDLLTGTTSSIVLNHKDQIDKLNNKLILLAGVSAFTFLFTLFTAAWLWEICSK